jgi:hypothetical protein
MNSSTLVRGQKRQAAPEFNDTSFSVLTRRKTILRREFPFITATVFQSGPFKFLFNTSVKVP